MFNEKYKFTEEWFDASIPTWQQVFEQWKTPINSVLEIGCYEGRATVWLCENVIKHGACYDVVDTFEGSSVETGMKGTVDKLADRQSFIEENFRHNISFFDNINFTIHKGYSQKVLPQLGEESKYDLIYIDASHRADDTLVDSYFAHKLLKPGGMLIFDDFGWKDPKDMSPINSPELGIKMFWELYQSEYNVLFQGYQIGVVKKDSKKIILT